MTISTTTCVIAHNGDGQKTVFTFNFLIPEGAMRVYLTENGVATIVPPEEYGVIGFDKSEGGSITFNVAPSASQIVTIRRYLNPTQTEDLVPDMSEYIEAVTACTEKVEGTVSAYANKVEDVLDRHAMVMQQLQYDMGRSVKAPVGSALDPDNIINTIEQAAEDAAASKDAALNAEEEAEKAKVEAAAAKDAAIVAKDAAVTAKDEAEAAKGAAETAAQAASDAKGTAETAAANAKTSEDNAAKSASDAAKIADELGDVTTSGGLVPAGAVMPFAMASAPTGWLECNGAAVSRETYAALYAAIGNTYGSGDGSSTFNLPDLRGEFIRGFDHGRGVDAGRVLGSAQGDELKSHTHGYYRSSDTQLGGGGWGASPSNTEQTTATGGSETRPRNVAMMYCIKAA